MFRLDELIKLPPKKIKSILFVLHNFIVEVSLSSVVLSGSISIDIIFLLFF